MAGITATMFDKVLAKRTVSPVVRTGGTINGAAVDLGTNGGAQDALVSIITGTISDGSHAVVVEDSADGSTGWVAIPAAQLQGSPPTIVAANSDTEFEVGITDSQQFVRVSITTTGATIGGTIAAAVLTGSFRHSPIR